jgi:hypothetical protein
MHGVNEDYDYKGRRSGTSGKSVRVMLCGALFISQAGTWASTFSFQQRTISPAPVRSATAQPAVSAQAGGKHGASSVVFASSSLGFR